MNIIHMVPFTGIHCESTVIVNLLNQKGINLSEAMVFGLGRGLGYIYWKAKNMPFPFIGGRIQPDQLTENVMEALSIKLNAKQSSSSSKAWKNLTAEINAGNAVGLKLDSYYLDYCDEDFHFAAHYLTCIGYDDKQVYLIDSMTKQNHCTTSIESLEKARSYKGPMSSKGLSFTINTTDTPQLLILKDIIPKVIEQKALSFLNPPIKNMSYKGILKTSQLIVNWLETVDEPQKNLPTIGYIMEQAGTGGGLFRRLWSAFLSESAEITGNPQYQHVANQYTDIANRWTEIARLITLAGEFMDKTHLVKAADMLVQLSIDEKQAMEALLVTARQKHS